MLYYKYVSRTRNRNKWVRIRFVPLSKTLYHTCFSRRQRWKWWSRLPKLTSRVIWDIKFIIYFFKTIYSSLLQKLYVNDLITLTQWLAMCVLADDTCSPSVNDLQLTFKLTEYSLKTMRYKGPFVSIQLRDDSVTHEEHFTTWRSCEVTSHPSLKQIRTIIVIRMDPIPKLRKYREMCGWPKQEPAIA